MRVQGVIDISKAVDVGVKVIKSGVGWSVVNFIIYNKIDYPVEIILRYVDGPSDTVYYASDSLVLDFKRGDENGIALHMGGVAALVVKAAIYATKVGEYLFDIYWRKSDETRKHYLKTFKLIVSKPSPVSKIDPFDEKLYQKLDDGLPRFIVSLIDVVKVDDSYLAHVTLYDRVEKTAFNSVYDVKELVRSVGGDEVELSPIAGEIISQMKEFIQVATNKPKYISASYVITFKFNAYVEFFRNLFKDRDNAINYFRKRIVEEVVKGLKKANIKFAGVSANIVNVEYDYWGIITGMNPNVKITARVNITFDPISLAMVAVIVAGAVIAVLGGIAIHEYFETIRMHDKEYYETVREYYKTLQEIVKARVELINKEIEVAENPKIPLSQKERIIRDIERQLGLLDKTEEKAHNTIEDVNKSYQEWLKHMKGMFGEFGAFMNLIIVFIVLMLILSLVGGVKELIKK